MRTIKFRAWDKDRKQMVEFGRPIYDPKYGGILFHSPYQFLDWNKNEVMQFTGLLDKNGKEIWEGDIVKWTLGRKSNKSGFVEGISQIIWGDDCGFEESDKPDKTFGFHIGSLSEMEIIGNIHENPELLTKNL